MPATLVHVEDNTGDAQMMEVALEEYGVRASSVVLRSGEDALRYFARLGKADAPKVVVLDWRLPGRVSGEDVLRYLRGHPLLGAVPVVVFTGMGSGAERCRTLGAQSVMPKPCTLAECGPVARRLGGYLGAAAAASRPG